MATIDVPANGSTSTAGVALDISNTGPGVGVRGTSTDGGIGVTGNAPGTNAATKPRKHPFAVFPGLGGSGSGGTGVAGTGAIGVMGEGTHTGVYAANTTNHTTALLCTSALSADLVGGVRIVGAMLVGDDKNGAVSANNGDLTVTGNLQVVGDIFLPNADCAEDFDVSAHVDVLPGMVVALDEGGTAKPCDRPYDKTVLGIVSGAGAYRPAIVLDRHSGGVRRAPIALIGKVMCLVDATTTAIEAGDLLTTSATPGHAMKATDLAGAIGTIIGKALGSLAGGRGLVPVLVMLR